jgi:hypothetical protein
MISGHLYTAAADGQHKVIEPIPEKNKKIYLVISKEFWPYIFLRPAMSQPAPWRTSGLGV